jgi:hypothetical protein
MITKRRFNYPMIDRSPNDYMNDIFKNIILALMSKFK